MISKIDIQKSRSEIVDGIFWNLTLRQKISDGNFILTFAVVKVRQDGITTANILVKNLFLVV